MHGSLVLTRRVGDVTLVAFMTPDGVTSVLEIIVQELRHGGTQARMSFTGPPAFTVIRQEILDESGVEGFIAARKAKERI